MNKKILGLILSVVMMIQLTLGTFANSIVFLDADNNAPVTELAQHENVNARVEFTAEKAGDVQIYTVGYDKSGTALKNVVVDTINVEEGQEVDLTTTAMATAGLDNIKVFAWYKNMLSPVFCKKGVISSIFTDVEGYSEKFTTTTTEETPKVVVTGTTITAGELFAAIDGAEINNTYFSVLANESTVSMEFTKADNWAESTIALSGEGVIELTALDYSFCVPTVAYVEVVKSTDATLSALSIEGVEISPAFDAATESYTATVPYETEKVTVAATTNDANATVVGTGEKALVVGANTIEVTVTAEDGTTTKTYTIVVERAAYIPSSNATLKSLSIEGVEISPAFDAATESYTATVPYETEKVTVAATNDANATVVGTGEKALVVGANTVEVTVTAEDGTTTKTYTIVVTREPAIVEKFTTTTTAEAPKVVVTGKTIKAGDLFTAIDGADIKIGSIEITATGTAQVTLNKDNWAESTIALSSEGVVEVTVQDNSYCTPTIAYVKVVAPVERYGTVFDNTETYLHRVGNLNTVKLSQLFTAKDAELPIENIKVETATVYGAAEAAVEMKTNWGDSVVTFSKTGVVSLTISDDNSKPYTLKLEVVDAKNITKAESATANSVVLLNDISSTGFTVSGGYTFYGNGFTVTVPAASTVQNTGAGFTGWISIGASQDSGTATGGNLDNVRIVGPVYPEMYIWRDQAKITDSSDADYGDGSNMRYFKNTVIIYGGDVTISNSYISGSRAALCLKAGNNIVLKNTTLSGGAFANMHIAGGAVSVTLDNVTTVQTDVADSYGAGKTAHGIGVAVESNTTPIYIKGELTQHNWINEEKWNSTVSSTYRTQFPKFFTNSTFSNYWHYLNGGTDPYVNLGMIYVCDWDTSKIHDERTDAVKTVVPYATCNATVAGKSGGICSKINTSGDAITDADLAEPGYGSSGFIGTAPTFSFDNTPNNDAKDESNAVDTYCVYTKSTKTLDIGITGDTKTLDLSKVKVYHYGNEVARELYLNGTKLSGDTATVNIADGTKQTLTVKATTIGGFDKEGNVISGSQDYSFDITINVAKLSFAAPEWNMGGSYTFDTSNCVYAYYKYKYLGFIPKTQGYGEAVPIYEGIKVKYYNKNGILTERDLSGTTVVPTGSNNANTNAFTYTLDDGSILTMKFSSGWKSGASTHQFTTYKNKVYIYPQSLDNDNYIRAKVTNQDFNVKINYTFTDPWGKSTATQTMTWYNAAASNGSVATVGWKAFDSTNGKGTE